MSYCTQCGNYLAEHHKYCSRCGTPSESNFKLPRPSFDNFEQILKEKPKEKPKKECPKCKGRGKVPYCDNDFVNVFTLGFFGMFPDEPCPRCKGTGKI